MTKTQQRIILDALDQPDALTDWEYDFIDNLAEYEDWQELSDRQNEILLQIKDKL